MDDIIITETKTHQLQSSLHASFPIKDLGNLTYFLGLEVHTSAQGTFINQYKYTKDMIAMAQLENSTPVNT